MAKTQKRRIAAKEGEPISFTVTHKGLLAAATALINLIDSVTSITHSTASKTEKHDLAILRATLIVAGKAMQKIECPNPMYTTITVDKSRLVELKGH